MLTRLESTYFFTATILNWQALLSTDTRKQVITDSLSYCCEKKRIQLHAFVVMPNHIHLLLTLGSTETTMTFQRDFLKFTSQLLIRQMMRENNLKELENYRSTQKDRIYQIWERRPKWIQIYNTLIAEQKMAYMHDNPLKGKWQLALAPEEYQWSSAAFYEGEPSDFSFLTHIAAE